MPCKRINSKRMKEIRKILERDYGVDERLDYTFFISSKNDLYIMSNGIKDLPFDYLDLRIHSIGIYFGELKHDEIRVSIEGSQIVDKFSDIGTFNVSSEIARSWFKGNDIPCMDSSYDNSYVIVRNKDTSDVLGSGRCKDGILLNHVPKGRRIHGDSL